MFSPFAFIQPALANYCLWSHWLLLAEASGPSLWIWAGLSMVSQEMLKLGLVSHSVAAPHDGGRSWAGFCCIGYRFCRSDILHPSSWLLAWDLVSHSGCLQVKSWGQQWVLILFCVLWNRCSHVVFVWRSGAKLTKPDVLIGRGETLRL